MIDGEFVNGWRVAKTGSGAIYLNRNGFHMAVWEDRDHSGEFTWHLLSDNRRIDRYSTTRYSSEEKAKLAVCAELCKEMGH